MMRIRGNLVAILVLVFLASMALFALFATGLAPASGISQGLDTLEMATAQPRIYMVAALLQPRSFAIGTLLALVFVALCYHATRPWHDRMTLRTAEAARHRPLLRQLGGLRGAGDRFRSESTRAADMLAERAPFVLALLAGTIWPWLVRPYPLAAFLIAIVMLAGFLGAAIRGLRIRGGVRKSAALSFVAGWATLVTFALFVSLLQNRLGAPQFVAAMVGMPLLALATVCVQLRLGRTISYSVAVIWGLIGIAAVTVLVNPALATLAVLAIAVIVFGLVQVTT